MTLQFHPYDAAVGAAIRAGGPDAYGNPAEPALSDGDGVPCRSCLQDVPAGQTYLTLAARPFASLQPFANLRPFAETGPIFLGAKACTPWSGAGVPPILVTSPEYLLKGYSADKGLIYDTGRVVAADQIGTYAEWLFLSPQLAYVDVRSVRNTCFQARITRGA